LRFLKYFPNKGRVANDPALVMIQIMLFYIFDKTILPKMQISPIKLELLKVMKFKIYSIPVFMA
jgi:hypothetical protein